MERSLRPYLEDQADRVEAILAAHKTPGRVVGGTVGPQLIRFFLAPAPCIRLAEIERLVDDLALAMQVRELRIDRNKAGVVLEFANPQPRPVTLLNLLPEVMPLPLTAAVLGLCDDGAPLLARLTAPEAAHILISGDLGAGKSALLHTLAASLLLTHMPSLLRVVCIAPRAPTFAPFAAAPHLVRPPITTTDTAIEALRSVLHVLEAREQRNEIPDDSARYAISIYGDRTTSTATTVPHIVVLIDDVEVLLQQRAPQVVALLTALLLRGQRSGIHIVAARNTRDVTPLPFPLRIAEDNARGYFVAGSEGAAPIRFQGAYIKAAEIQQQMQMLNGGMQNVLDLRQPSRGYQLAGA